MIHKVKAQAPSFMRHMISAAALASCALPGVVGAFEIETGSEDFKLRWDNTVRYNLGVRVEDCDPNICGNGAGAGDVTAHQSDRKFGKAGNIVTNRLDLFTEFDAVFKEDMGFRISAAGWYDQAYHDTRVSGDPAFLAGGLQSFPTGEYSNFTKRYYAGPSGEVLDFFFFGKANLGDVPVSIKVGKHNVYWGESLFSFVGGVAYGQGPVDIRKALANPGSEAKELFKPLNQISFSASLTDRMSFAGQYFLDWKPSTLPEGGTYFGPADFFTQGGGSAIPILAAPPPNGFGVAGVFTGANKPDKKTGDWGLALKWRPEWLDGSAGFYYRQYTDKLPQMVIDGFTSYPTVALDYRTPRAKMFGFSLAKPIAGVSVGMDVTYRKNAQVGAKAFSPVFMYGADWRPTGDVFTALINSIAYFGSNPVFDSAALTSELNYSRLREVTHDPYSVYFGLPANCGSDGVATNHGCPTKDAWGFAVQFEPKWFQVVSGLDISAPVFLGLGLKGNSPVPFGDNEGQGSYSFGVTGDLNQKYNFSLKFNGFLAKHSQDHLGAGGNSNASLGKFWDRNFVSLTLKTTF